MSQLDLLSSPAEGFTLRPYQLKALDELDVLLAMGTRNVLICAPTGAGKTILAAELIRRWVALGKRILFLAPRRELIEQTCKKVDIVGVKYGVIQAGDPRVDSYAMVQVASEDTLIARAVRKDKGYGNFDIILKDEAHVGVTDARERLFALWPNAPIIGMTATPCRSDGKAMGRIYDEMLIVSTTKELTEQGYLVPGRYFSVSEPDLRKVRTTAGDYNKGDLATAMNKPKLVGDIVQTWLERASTRRTVVFATNIEHSQALCNEFIRHGVAAEHVDANTPQAAREVTFDNFQSGRTQVLTNCTLASIGFDLPELDCVVFARPTKSLGLYIQMLGRGLRTSPGKTDCLVLDHAGNVLRHGLATDERFWTLHGVYAQDEAKVAAAKKEKEEKEIMEVKCPECSAVIVTRECPECGYFFPPKAKRIETITGQLVEVGTKGALDPDNAADRRTFYAMLCGHAQLKGYSLGWAAHKYKEKFESWPPYAWKDEIQRSGGITPTLEVSRWIQSRMIAWSRGRQRAANAPTANNLKLASG